MRMKILAAMLVLFVLGAGAAGLRIAVRSSRAIHPKTGEAITLPGQDGKTTLLFNGWRISPAGRHIQTGDMPLGGAISPDGSTLAITNSGYGAHELHLIDIAAEKETFKLPLSRTWNGIAWAPDGAKLYVAGGVSNLQYDVYVLHKKGAEWEKARGFKLTGSDPQKTCVAGLALTADGRNLLALNNSDGHVYILGTESGEAVARMEVGDHPITVRVAGSRAYIANLGGSEVATLDITDVRNPRMLNKVATGQHPNDIVIAADGRLFVSCGNSDEVTVIDQGSGSATESIKTSLTPRAPSGSTPNAIAISPDGKSLYVANADNNNVCVIDVSRKGRSRVAGFIPTGWYPTSVHVTPDGKRLIIGSGKGMGTTGPNPVNLPIDKEIPRGFTHHGRLLNGFLSFVDQPSESTLREYSRQCLANSPYRDTHLKGASWPEKTPIPTRIGAKSPIRYVLYIIKENRTYDQVFGDLPRGNGDPKLTLFGRDVTPNQHALAEQFVLLDNLYCSGEVSADGHPWSTSAYATDFTQRSWVLSYSLKGSTVRTDSVADPKGGYIWEACARKGIPYRSYGEYWNHRTLKGNVSEEFVGKTGSGEAAPGRDTDKAEIFIKEFKEFEKKGKIPRFMIMSLGENHTNGTRPGSYTPRAMVASNDQAVGKIVEAITQSSVWKEFAIFVIEDDAQNGPDHVDSHRTCGLVISPYTRRGAVDSTMYSTASMLRTMELILGLDPLSQYDAAATPMFNSFTDRAEFTTYQNQPPQVDLNVRNKATAYGAAESARMDWSEFDRIDEQALNRILWHSTKGAHVPMPPIVRRALVTR